MISVGKFSKREHLLKSREFGAVYKKGRSFKKNGFVLCVMPNGLAQSRLGFSISSANVKLASIRNRIRRLFREIYRKNRTDFKSTVDMVLIVRKSPGKKFLYKEAEASFFALAKEANILV